MLNKTIYAIVRPELVTQVLRIPISKVSLEKDGVVSYYNPKTDKNRPKPARYCDDAGNERDDLQIRFGRHWYFVYGTDWHLIGYPEAQRLTVEHGLNDAGLHYMGYLTPTQQQG